jgi:hypothetical protein
MLGTFQMWTHVFCAVGSVLLLVARQQYRRDVGILHLSTAAFSVNLVVLVW